ncbi:hypothetical protein JWG45_03375 [Leptospira sp. 201903070]|uniref:Uncharacterized protein n=1 Tax=Leptospira ainlahdjerensis TaxID=2810033 RepID=A0ABS2U739_9LEPT|nr:hypothetical protein [Leptospira ainlahdjerensis]
MRGVSPNSDFVRHPTKFFSKKQPIAKILIGEKLLAGAAQRGQDFCFGSGFLFDDQKSAGENSFPKMRKKTIRKVLPGKTILGILMPHGNFKNTGFRL